MYKSVDMKKSLPELEQEVLEYWRKEKIFEKVQEERKDGEPFIFFEGPPTANAKPGIHHVEARAFKDLIPRYQTMKGKRVDRKAGWDTHGLPVELQVEKKLGLKNKKEIEAYGVEKFNAECKKDVWEFTQDWIKLTERIGFWLDLEHPYITYTNEYIQSVWSILKHAHEQHDKLGRSLIYLGHKVVPYCTRCGTALSSHEVAQGYKVVTEPSVYIKFHLTEKAVTSLNGRITNRELRITNQDSVYAVAWTTTPWTLPGNVGLAVGKDIDYSVVKSGDEYYILAKDLVEQVFGASTALLQPASYNLLASFKGSDLLGLEYEPLFPDVIKPNDKAFKIYPADFVTTQEGTGVVHTAVMYGEDDYNLGSEVGLPKQHSVGEDGRFLPGLEKYGLAGKYVKAKETEELIIDSLKSRNLLLGMVDYAHDYPFCWRCDTPLLYYARNSWFIRMSEFREGLIKRNNTINWEPATIKTGRMGEWLENVKDWAISRERYWGTPLPFWMCKNDHLTVVGSVNELGDLTNRHPRPDRGSRQDEMDSRLRGNDRNVVLPADLHRPYIDEVKFACPECGEEAKRILEVADVWLDSGSMPFSQWGFPGVEGSKDQLDSHYPANYISEAIDQTRGWFYTMLAVATLMGKEAPYKNVICLGHVMDENGKKMSKSKGNIINPWDMLDKYGADALRFYFYSINPPGEPKFFAEKDLQSVQRRVLMIWWNVYSFFVTYANEAGWEFSSQDSPHPSPLPEGEGEGVGAPTKNPSPEGEGGRRPGEGIHDSLQSKNVLDKWVLARLNQTINTTTALLDKYNVLEASRNLATLIDDISTWYLRRSRSRFSDSANEEDRNMAFATLHHVLIQLSKLMAPFTPFMAENVFYGLRGKSVHLATWSAIKEISKEDLRLIDMMTLVRKIVSNGLEARMRSGVKVRQPLSHLIVGGRAVSSEEWVGYTEIIMAELNVKEVSFDNNLDSRKHSGGEYIESGEGKEKVLLDIRITPELELEGMLRELIRGVQDWRKNHGLTVAEKVKISWFSEDERVRDLMAKKALVESLSSITRSEVKEGGVQRNESQEIKLNLNGHEVYLLLEKM